MRPSFPRGIYASINQLIISIILIALMVILALLSGCGAAPVAGTTAAVAASDVAAVSSTLQAQLSSFCAIAPSEVQAFIAGEAALGPAAPKALNTIQLFVQAECAPGVVANSMTLQQFAADILPAFTTLALEYSAAQKGK